MEQTTWSQSVMFFKNLLTFNGERVPEHFTLGILDFTTSPGFSTLKNENLTDS